MQTITFNKSGYDPFIDYIKAFAIIFVLIGHTFPFLNYWAYGLWMGIQVPLFVLVQSFHCFKKEKASFHFVKTLWRVVVPFLVIQILLFAFSYVKNGDSDVVVVLKKFGISGGLGPGSYYPWVYLQIAILLPFVKKWIIKGKKWQIVLMSIIICESLEVVSAVTDLPDFIYRLLAIRYFFLFYFAWVWVKEGVTINKKTVLLSLLTLFVAIYFYYFSIDDEPFFYHTKWKCHRWPCYYYVAIGGIYLLHLIYQRIKSYEFLDKSIRLLAKSSYEIFLIQMAILVILPSVHSTTEILNSIGIGTPTYVRGILFFIKIAIVFIVSIWGGHFLHIMYNKFLKNLGITFKKS